MSPHLYAVADTDRSLEKKDYPGDKIRSDILQPKPDTDRQKPKDNRQTTEIDPNELEGENETDYQQEVVDHSPDRVRLGIFDPEPAHRAPDDVAGDHARCERE